MSWTKAQSDRAATAWNLVTELQQRMVDNLTAIARDLGSDAPFAPIEWLRDGGRHGGGTRYAVADSAMLNRASVNVSQVHYDDMLDKRLASATALSTIIHPTHPRAPSFHMHISWTKRRDRSGYWRLMADLNPSLADAADTAAFADTLRNVAPALYDRAAAEGDRYFHIPVLGRHRGVAHYYLDGYNSGDFATDRELARTLGLAAADRYAAIVRAKLDGATAPTTEERTAQLAYHSLYLLQVLTLDRGTTSGLLVHDQNDVGILASLPSRVDRPLLDSWASKLPPPQDELLRDIVAALPSESPCPVDDAARAVLAGVVRQHYRAHPEALAMQASASIVPPTVANHQASDD